MLSLSSGISLMGFFEYSERRNANWAIGAGIFAVIVPYTLLILRPLYIRLLEAERNGDTKETDKGMKTWI